MYLLKYVSSISIDTRIVYLIFISCTRYTCTLVKYQLITYFSAIPMIYITTSSAK